ncbi:uncharacterized protein LOC132610806 isoform X2 [Lycium barbarum]|uniref:uncharacterized protein LOC132610806 isoform X2 n=1 Tax=Lycium barbarum TaxID=112863 RepID=UPI00293E04E2|nr:uncharacterized protein LOC132610806 isoform X2 [Lycium barbarum]
MLEDIRIKLQAAAETVQDVPLSAPQASQDSDFVFMPNPGFASSSQPVSEAAGPSNQRENLRIKLLHLQRDLPKIMLNLQVSSRALVDEDDDEGKLDDEDDQPILRPKVISEGKTRLKLKKLHQQSTSARKTGFKRDENGVSMPTNLSYSPRQLAWIGRPCVTSNQLAAEKEKKIDKLKAKRGKH